MPGGMGITGSGGRAHCRPNPTGDALGARIGDTGTLAGAKGRCCGQGSLARPLACEEGFDNGIVQPRGRLTPASRYGYNGAASRAVFSRVTTLGTVGVRSREVLMRRQTARAMADLVILGACVLTTGCSDHNPAGPDIPYRQVGEGNLAALTGSLSVIRDPQTWADFVSASGLRDPAGHAPHVNFSTEMAVALFLGQRPSGGYQITVTRVERRGTWLVIMATESVPCVAILILTNPVAVVAVPKSTDPIVVEWHQTGPVCF
jgi:hypothetical protein